MFRSYFIKTSMWIISIRQTSTPKTWGDPSCRGDFMPAFIQFGFIQSNVIASAGSFNLGVNVIQNRNSTKQNIGNYTIFEGICSVKTEKALNFDPDYSDNSSFDANNYAGVQF